MAWVDLACVAERPIIELETASGGITLPALEDGGNPAAATAACGNPNPSFNSADISWLGGKLYRIIDVDNVGSKDIPAVPAMVGNYEPVYNWNSLVNSAIIGLPTTARPSFDAGFAIDGVETHIFLASAEFLDELGGGGTGLFYNNRGIGIGVMAPSRPTEAYINEIIYPGTLNIYNGFNDAFFNGPKYATVFVGMNYYFAMQATFRGRVAILNVTAQAFNPGGAFVFVGNRLVFDNADLNVDTRFIGQDGEYFIYAGTNSVDRTYIIYVKYDGSTYRAYSIGQIQNIATDWQNIWGFKE